VDGEGPDLHNGCCGGHADGRGVQAEGRGGGIDLIPTLRKVEPYCYIASPYSKYPDGIHAAFVEVCKVGALLISQGVRIYVPIAHTHPIAIHGNLSPQDHDVWLPADRPFMETSGALVVVKMPSWRDSYGIQVEVEQFQKDAKPVFLLGWPLDMRGELFHGAR
jgi:hypothetical protein